MSAARPDPSEEHFSSLLAAYDEALTTGTDPARDGATELPPEVRLDLERDLACAQLLHQVLEYPAPAAVAEPPGSLPWSRLGRFEIRRELGRGTFGVVYLAYDPPLRREVALKVPRAEVATDARLRARFAREARAAAGLEHPHIVPVYEVGEVGPVCFLVSAYCPGPTLAQWLKQRDRPVPAQEVAALVATLADAIQHAHSRGVVHRDLKPSNILLQEWPQKTQEDAKREEPQEAGSGASLSASVFAPFRVFCGQFSPKITDFGLAKLLLEQAEVGQTRSEAIVGTASYMAPEQAGGQSRGVGPEADVYALGAILYELLTGRPPFQAETSLDTLMQVRTAEPVPPGRLRLGVPRDLDTVCLKCLEKEPARRYPSAAALADDLRRFQAGEPIRARPVSAWERGRKWARRRPAVAALLAAVVLVGAAGFAAVTWQWQRTETARQDLEVNLYFRRIALAQAEWLANNFSQAERLLDECPPHLRGWEWHYVRGLRQGNPPPLRGHASSVFGVAFSPDGKRLVTSSSDETVRLWEAETGRELLKVPGSRQRYFGCVAFSPDGRLFAAPGDNGQTVVLWNAQTGDRAPLSFRRAKNVNGMTFSPDGRRLAAVGGDPAVTVWDLVTGQEEFTLAGHTANVLGVAFSPDGQLLASAGANPDRTVKLWDMRTRQVLRACDGHTEGVRCVAFSPDGKLLASGSGTVFRGGESEVMVWDTATGQRLHVLRGHSGIVESVAFSPDGRRLASAGFDQMVKIWDLATGQEALTLRGHTDRITSVAFSPDGRRLVSASQDRTLRFWDATPLDERPVREVRTFAAHTGRITCVALSPDGRWLASAGQDRAVRLWDRTTDEPLVLLGHTNQVNRVMFDPEGRCLVSVSDDGTAKIWDLVTGKEPLSFPEHARPVRAVAFSLDGRSIATGDNMGTVLVWHAATRTRIHTFDRGHTEGVTGLAFAGDGRHLVSGSWDRIAKVWDLETGRAIATLTGHEGRLQNVACDSHAKYVATTGTDGVVKIWDGRTWGLLHTLRGHTGWVWCVAFSPDGRFLASAGNDATVRLWHVATGHLLHTFYGHTRWVEGVAFSPDGKSLASASWDGTAKVWDVPSLDREFEPITK